MNDFVSCTLDIDSPDLIRITEVNIEKLQQLGYRLEYEIASYHKEVGVTESLGEPIEITKEEFSKILKENSTSFDGWESTPQSCSYKTYPIENERKLEGGRR